MTDPKVTLELDRPQGGSLDALLALPTGEVRAYAVLAHRSPGSVDVIADSLTRAGIAVLAFEIGAAGAVADVVLAAYHLRANFEPPEILIGHSLGGVAVLSASHLVPEIRAVVTINAPAGEIPPPRTALLVMHAPNDQQVGIQNAGHLFVAARHPKSFIALDGADHALTNAADAVYAATMLGAWVGRYLTKPAAPVASGLTMGHQVVVRENGAPYAQTIVAGRHHLTADEPVPLGRDTGPTPYDLLLASLGSCTSMTIRMYAERKQIPLRDVSIELRHARVHAKDCEECETSAGMLDRIDLRITLDGDLTDEQREKLLAIAGKCPVHRTLHSEVQIRTAIAD
ncbi:bifunctional alpha/beta hydrolase/OsmC family protein [Kribbella sp. CA-253562]|uniref:bifunctional alpha/beta hydrolase/OsmC family protein n=1 Tax=Kribbella sp. CA-253562 TaxID=3239942 RepID=UPI003D8A9BF1